MPRCETCKHPGDALNVARFLGAGAMAVSGALLVWLITRGGV